MNPAGKDAVLNLLAVEFQETDAPAGVVTITFSGGATLRLEVECLEAELADLGPSWTTAACPVHEVIDDGPPDPGQARPLALARSQNIPVQNRLADDLPGDASLDILRFQWRSGGVSQIWGK